MFPIKTDSEIMQKKHEIMQKKYIILTYCSGAICRCQEHDAVASYLGYGICTGLSGLMIHFWVSALCPSKSGLMNKHIVKHILKQTF